MNRVPAPTQHGMGHTCTVYVCVWGRGGGERIKYIVKTLVVIDLPAKVFASLKE